MTLTVRAAVDALERDPGATSAAPSSWARAETPA